MAKRNLEDDWRDLIEAHKGRSDRDLLLMLLHEQRKAWDLSVRQDFLIWGVAIAWIITWVSSR